MSTGFLELIALLLSLGDMGVEPNPNAPSAAEVVKYAPARSDFMLYADLEAVIPPNVQRLQALPDDPRLESTPNVREQLEQVLQQIEMARTMVKSTTTIDPVSDLLSIAAWATYPERGQPGVLVVVRGRFPKDLIDRIAAKGTPSETVHGRTVLRDPGDQMMVGLTRDGDVVAGTPDMVEPRLQKGWSPPKRGRVGRRIAATLDDEPFFLAASTPSNTARERLQGEIGADNVGREIVGNELLVLALYHDGIGWSVRADDRAGYERAVLASEGVLDLFRASHHGMRGLAAVFLAAADGYPELAPISRHRAELLDLVEQMSGDGEFRVKWRKRPRLHLVSVRATDDELSDVVPAVGLLLPAAGAGYWLAVGRDEPNVIEGPDATSAVPPDVRFDPKRVYLQVKETHRRNRALD